MKMRVNSQAGFSLVEIVVGIVVSAIALTFLSVLFFSNAGRSVEPLLQIRAAEFGQSVLDEILSKQFDELTPLGGVPACTSCSTLSGDNSDVDGESREQFDDVDDYNLYCAARQGLVDSLGNPVNELAGYEMQICVVYDNDFNGIDDGAGAESNPLAKLVTVDIYPSSGAGLGGSPITFAAYRTNF